MNPRTGPLILLAAAMTPCCHAQTPVTPPIQTAPAQAASAASSSTPAESKSVPTIKTSTQIVIVDVVATDAARHPVHGLTAADFKLTENGAAQSIKSFEEHTALTPADATHLQPMPKLPPGIFTNYSPAPANGAVNILLLDTLNTAIKDQSYVRQQLLAYLKSVPPGTRIAIFGLTDHLILLQGFTSDPAMLRGLLEKHAYKASPVLDDPMGGGGIQNSMADYAEDMNEDPSIVANLRQFEAQQQSYQQQLRIRFTLDGFNQLARYLANIPGRKNLVWFSGSFPISILPDATGTLDNPFAVMADFGDEFRQTVDLLGRGQVAVYPVDARGLFNSPVFDVATTRNYSGPNGNARMVQDQNKFSSDTASENITMSEMADATGGRAFMNTNDLTHAVAEAIDQGSNFYTISYTPTNANLNGHLRKIKVQSARAGLTLTYRRGYYADAPDKVVTNATLSAAPMPDQAVVSTNGISPQDTLRLAMTRGAPAPADILFKTGVIPITPAAKPEESAAPGNTPAPKAHGPWRRYAVNYQIDPADLVFFRTTADDKIHADFDLIIFVYSPDGTLLNSASGAVHLAIPPDQLRQVIGEGVFCHEEVSAPAKGESFLRIAVHDLHRDHYGAVEVATSQVTNVTPQQPTAGPQTPQPARPTQPEQPTQPAQQSGPQPAK